MNYFNKNIIFGRLKKKKKTAKAHKQTNMINYLNACLVDDSMWPAGFLYLFTVVTIKYVHAAVSLP